MKLVQKQNCKKCNKETDLFHIIETKEGHYLVCEKCRNTFMDLIEKFCIDFIQPERSKREDLRYCCEILKKLEYIFQGQRLIVDVKKYVDDLIKDCKMRCSEHCGNTVRDK